MMGRNASNQSMEADGPIAKQLQDVCHRTLPWLISFSLDAKAHFVTSCVAHR
jgi:hypothetical protein